ncbi:hypothetical protein H8356DRAFT_1420255 [Neocallimastix lanati (nom. inval.)]|nr:hypothetical protein H8356DRAFT_1420255 [Neocallimastix sp. JGI-2020a]
MRSTLTTVDSVLHSFIVFLLLAIMDNGRDVIINEWENNSTFDDLSCDSGESLVDTTLSILKITNQNTSDSNRILQSLQSYNNNRNISSDFKCLLKTLVNHIWNGDPEDCNSYMWHNSPINNGLKLNSKYGIDKGFIRPKQFRFCNQEECISLYASL